MGVSALNLSLRDKIAGSVYGFVIGDAMGATTEFLTKQQVARMYGQVDDIIGGGWLNLEPGEITDDTQMTLCIMEAIMSGPKDSEEFIDICEDKFIGWLESGPKDVGNQCRKAIHGLMCGQKTPVDQGALGNGSLMRAMPLAILGLNYLNILQGLITHNNSICSKVILSYSDLLQDYLYDSCVAKYRNDVEKLLEPSGHVLNTYNNSVYWSKQKSFKKALFGAVNDGGDADTIAAITGSLAGARFGLKEIPDSWIKKINPEVRNKLDSFLAFVFQCLQI